MTKSVTGNFFEDFKPGQVIQHATPRTLTDGDAALNIALTGSRYALFSSDEFANACGLERAPIDPLFVFHVVFGKTVPDVSVNAVANLGYAEGRVLAPVYAGDTISSKSEVLGVKENSNGKTGVVYVRTTGANQHGAAVMSYVRWVMVNKRDAASPAPADSTPKLTDAVAAKDLFAPIGLTFKAYDWMLAGSPFGYADYAIGEKIDHLDGVTIEEAEHQIATRLYQNTAKVHFDQQQQAKSRFGKRLIYGGVAISTARALAFNGLANAGFLLGINAGRHVNPLFAGDTVYAWSEVLDKAELGGGSGALRLRLVALKNQPATAFAYKNAAGEYDPSVILDLDYWVAIP
jgi:2-methylfumaryl-CoA hydratase